MTEDLQGWRASVLSEDMVVDGLRIVAGVRGPQVTMYVKEIGSHGPEMVSVERGMEGPSLVLPIDLARALLDALSRHFGGTGTGRELRSDYNHERRRVDKLLDTLATIVASPSADRP